MSRWHEHSLMVGLVVVLLFGLVLGVIWWQQMRREFTPQRVSWSVDSLDMLGRSFLRQLQQLLQEALQSGPEAAVRVCADTAQRFTSDFARHHGISLRRVALRWRNRNNQPDSVEAWWIEQFQRWRQEGRSLDTLIVLRQGSQLHLLRPIVIQTPLCLMCHGGPDDIPPSVAQVIAEQYPEDRARGFRLGDVRGALSIRAVSVSP